MGRRLRIEFEGAIYHVMARGNGRQQIVRDDEDRERLLEDLQRAAVRCGWEVLAFVFLGNHLHLLIRTPQPNLGRGMQQFLSSYALWYGRRRRRAGHLFQGRYRAEPIEDESYYWAVSRYIHLNPVRAGLVERPAEWRWSSYPGYARVAARLPWVAYDALLSAWRGDRGGADPARAYRRFVEEGIRCPPPSPFREAIGGWVLGSERFLARLRELAGPLTSDPPPPEAALLRGRDPGGDPGRGVHALRPGPVGPGAAWRPAPRAGRRGVALPPAQRGFTPRTRPPAGPLPGRQRAQPDPPHRCAAADPSPIRG